MNINYKLPTLLILIVTLALSGCLTPNPTKSALESSLLDAQILSIIDVTGDYPEMQKASIGWYRTPTLDGKLFYDLSNSDSTNLYYLVWNKPTSITLNTNDINAGFVFSPQSYKLDLNDEKKIYEIKVSVNTLKTGQFEIRGLNIPPLTIKIP